MKKKACRKINSWSLMHRYVECYKTIATPMNTNKFTEFDIEK